ncbi:double-cubane-cluster-containing anaerobic reductase [Campylobacter sp. MG1]|uniref:double-cubane-cluster-containing anaerobic reductase n=1 Tax=Campylobacter sp. MG1 TaxID=2976332 RepID=UPI00226D34ED|nr:double-cubane-cluster-containing anaerobic reductase [Campylobacter sp. MG1]
MKELNKLPDGFDSFAEGVKNKFISLKKLKDEGGKVVGTYCSYVPTELIYAAGAIPLSLCATSEKPIKDAEKHLPSNLCPLIKASYGHAITDTCPFFYYSDFIVGETTCDGKKKMFELMNDIKHTYVMQLPQNNIKESSFLFFEEEVRALKDELEKFYNIKITDEMLKQAIKQGNEERKNLIEFYELSSLNPSPISGLEQFNVTESFGFMYDRVKKNEDLKQKTKEIYKNWEENLKGKIDNRPRILLSGCPLGGVKEKIIKTIEDLGAVVVGFDSCSGLRNQMTLIDENEEPIKAIARKYLKTNCSVMSPNCGRLDDIDYLIDKYKADGVIEVILLACHTFNIESHNVAKFCKSKNTPYLHIESDYSMQDKGQILTRIEAFLELLKESKND